MSQAYHVRPKIKKKEFKKKRKKKRYPLLWEAELVKMELDASQDQLARNPN